MNIEWKLNQITPQEYHDLRTAVGWATYTPEEISQGLKNTLFGVTGYRESKAVAMGRVIGDGKLVFYIQDIIVLPEFQGQGLGQQVMERIMEFIAKHSVNNSIIGLCSVLGKESFYERFGFFKRPHERFGCGMTQFVKK